MRVGLAQINTTVGDIDGNVAAILDVIAKADAEQVGLTLLPELALTGYPPEDLLGRRHFVDDQLDALERVAAACGRAVLLGYVDRQGDRLFNAAALCGNGRILRVFYKRMLPNYGVFDERRYFTAGEEPGFFELGGSLFGVTVCEDVWEPGPVKELADAGCSVILNISASPFHAGKAAEREAMLAARASDNNVWLAYCNLVGGQDELVFDGRSAVVSPEGVVTARGPAFEEAFVTADFAPGARLGAGDDLRDHPRDDEEVYLALVTGLRDYVHKNGFTDVVLGLSGGIDSALTAVIAVDALGAEHVHGVMMPSRFSSTGSVEDSVDLASNLGIQFLGLPVEGPFGAFLETLEPVFEGAEWNVAEENLQARVRGTLLMALSNKFGWLVLATGNKSELSVGYSTLYGDMVGGFAPIKDVFKTRVYSLAHWRNRDGEPIPRVIIEKAPSAELRENQLDQDSLPPYDLLDVVLERYVEHDQSREEIVSAGYDGAVVNRVCDMVDAAEYKRRQGPLGIKITPKAFGRDRRVPVTNRYRG